MLTGVIYGAIVVAWAAYLVPLALRRHDEASRSRSIERFSSAMRILARRGSAPVAAVVKGSAGAERVVVAPKRVTPRVLTPDLAPEPKRVLMTPARNRAAERLAAARRRRVLSMLVALTVFMGFASLVGLVPRVWVAAPVVLILGFLVTARLSVRRARKPYWVEVPLAEEPSAVVVRRSPVRVDATRGGADGDDSADEEPTITLTAAQRAAASGDSAAASRAPLPTRTADGGSLWAPLQVTPPLRAADRLAPRTVRTVPIGGSGPATASSSGAVRRPAPRPKSEPTTEPDNDVEITDEVARVVNG